MGGGAGWMCTGWKEREQCDDHRAEGSSGVWSTGKRCLMSMGQLHPYCQNGDGMCFGLKDRKCDGHRGKWGGG